MIAIETDTAYRPGLTFEQYSQSPGLNFSTLKHASVSARHLKAAIDGKLDGEDSEARRLGRAVHVRLLEGEREFRSRFLVASPCAAVIKTGDRKGQPCGDSPKFHDIASMRWFCGRSGHAPNCTYQPADFIGADELERVEGICEAVAKHEVAGVLRAPGDCELSLFWERNGVRLKSRLDKLIPGNDSRPTVVLDLKKCSKGCVTDEDCADAVANYSLHAQAASYCEAVKAVQGVENVAFVWIFVEDSPPFDINAIQCDEETLTIGLHEFDGWLSKYKDSLESGRWEGSCRDIKTGGLPNLYRRRVNG